MKKKLNFKSLIVLIFFIICLIGLFYSSYKIIMWTIDSKNTNHLIKDTVGKTEIKESDNEEAIIIDEDDYYWKYIDTNLIDVNFDQLKKINNEVVGWLQVNNTNINYPFVQTNNNSYYLTKSFDKKNNSAGWVFLDYRNNINNLDQNTIIYAHGRLERTMFGSLKDTLTDDWLQNKRNHVIKISTEKMNSLWKVFSVYHLPTTDDYLSINFTNNDNYNSFINMIKSRSYFDFETDVNTEDKILTLSTCYNNDEKLVLHAKLIKYEIK